MVMARPATNPVIKPAAQVNRIKIVIARPFAAARAGPEQLGRGQSSRGPWEVAPDTVPGCKAAQRTALGSRWCWG